ncbi:hypothetical protein ACNHYB_14020 [Isoptericola jiangsuensis]|uniref:hypothetical protein n=1 Tax=Isoptericola jiangsuensis TaxID=548579 RepID=UPI003AABA758
MSIEVGPGDCDTGDAAAQLAEARDRIAMLERLIRQERAQYLVEQRRAADAMSRLRAKVATDDADSRLRKAQLEIAELSRYRRQVERLESSPFFGPAHRLWRRFRVIRGYDQKVG